MDLSLFSPLSSRSQHALVTEHGMECDGISRVRKTQRNGKLTHVARRFAGCFRIDVSDWSAANLRTRRLTLET
jgi:hypothetical protein